ncbi:hypothetical protein [Pseudomonas viridiflava]|uniref:hypothetical protein n=1 Tax=Pseudomonas viridiflava TaxID=33069 RepID=UPI000F0283E1|nr:hypothetical protein [Pseudomonas viridiflava]MDY0917768.1 hypothetical protein [Pseudomonas viridiflava]
MTIQRLVVLGDSHLEALQLAVGLGLLKVQDVTFSVVPGATAVGLRNPNSITDALNIFRTALAAQPKDSAVLMHLGEVDCGFVIWWRAERYGESTEVQFQDSIHAYRLFLNEVLLMGFSRVCITGASLPTIRDGTDMGEVANKRAEVKVSLVERTELTFRYNQSLREMAIESGVDYFDITDSVVDQSTRLVHDFFRNPDPCNHHLDVSKVVGVWAGKCNDFFYEANISLEKNLVRTVK